MNSRPILNRNIGRIVKLEISEIRSNEFAEDIALILNHIDDRSTDSPTKCSGMKLQMSDYSKCS